MARALLALVVALAVAVPAGAGRLEVSRPLLLRLEGRVGPPQEATRGASDWQLVSRGHRIRFQLTRLVVLGGNASSGNVVAALGPYRPQATLYGPKEQLAVLAAATPTDELEIIGNLVGNPGAAQLLVSRVSVKAAPAPGDGATPPERPPAVR